MSVLGGIIAGVAAKIGAELVGKALGDRFGPAGGALAETVIGTVAEKLGVEPDALPNVPAKELEKAVKATEADMPELIALWAKGLDGQFGLLKAEAKEGLVQSAWRWGWMYLLAVVWTWTWMAGPIVNHFADQPIELPDRDTLTTVTGWFMALYMGGHTIKALGENAIAAVKSWRGK
jgi:hypothetical protein